MNQGVAARIAGLSRIAGRLGKQALDAPGRCPAGGAAITTPSEALPTSGEASTADRMQRPLPRERERPLDDSIFNWWRQKLTGPQLSNR